MMKRSTPIYTSPDDVEAAFYVAFSHCDLRTMENVWADDDVICVHPGSQAIVGHTAVIRSWAHIFSNAALPSMQINVIKRTGNETMAVHVVEEHIATGEHTSATVLATNVYQKYAQGWLMVEHHAAVVQGQTKTFALQ
jgi:ketosteroid isomerase-like protein